jgi:hypothetical protein
VKTCEGGHMIAGIGKDGGLAFARSRTPMSKDGPGSKNLTVLFPVAFSPALSP